MTVADCHGKTDRIAEQDDQKRSNRQRQIEADGHACVIAKHGDEMCAPDRHARGQRRHGLPADALLPGRGRRFTEKPGCHPRTGAAE